ncbi:MAG: DIP1984 family protein [Ktedonobacterales bacterium]
MKLAEALVLRADAQKRIEQLRERLQQSALVQEGEAPPEDPQELLGELERLLGDLTRIIGQINRTNLATQVTGGMTLTDGLARRDTLALHSSILESVATVASNRVSRYSRSEIRMAPTVDVAALRRQVDALARQRRDLDTAIQAANWTADLLE